MNSLRLSQGMCSVRLSTQLEHVCSEHREEVFVGICCVVTFSLPPFLVCVAISPAVHDWFSVLCPNRKPTCCPTFCGPCMCFDMNRQENSEHMHNDSMKRGINNGRRTKAQHQSHVVSSMTRTSSSAKTKQSISTAMSGNRSSGPRRHIYKYTEGDRIWATAAQWGVGAMAHQKIEMEIAA
jgi:hypothetical protein